MTPGESRSWPFWRRKAQECQGQTAQAVLVHVAAGEVAAGVGAVIVDDVGAPLVQEDCELEAADLDVLSAALFQLVQLTQ